MTEKRHLTRNRTVQWLAEAYYRSGRAPVADEVGRHWLLPPIEIIRHGSECSRTDVVATDKISYLSFDAADLIAPYSIQRATFHQPPDRDALMYHDGTELLLPTSGRVQYVFAWGKPTPGHLLEPEPLRPGQLIRLTPTVPHMTGNAEGGPAVAWMIFRPLTGAQATIVRPRDKSVPLGHEPRRITQTELSEPGRYFLISSGLASLLRTAREGAGFSFAELQQACKVDAAHLSRIEDGRANPSLDTLYRLGRVLRVDVGACFMNLAERARPYDVLPTCDDPDVTAAGLRVYLRNLMPGQSHPAIHPSFGFSLVVVSGRVILHMASGDQHVVNEDEVAHVARSAAPGKIEAIAPSLVMFIMSTSAPAWTAVV